MSTCLFCRIVERTVPSNITYEDDLALAFEDVNPQAPVHILVIPKRHIQSVGDLETADSILLAHLVLTCAKIAKQKGLAQSGYRLVTNTGANGGQTVFHLHWHLLGGRPMRWPPG
ncbi:MAG: histidine triad nucleotide-binding protein [Nitrospiraceae bacterium]